MATGCSWRWPGDPDVAPSVWAKQLRMDPVTENPALGATEAWKVYNTTADAHQIHIHGFVFEVVNRRSRSRRVCKLIRVQVRPVE